MKFKTLLWIVVSVLAAAGAAWWLWRPQTITLSNGAKLKLLAVTYGKHHNFPGVKTPARDWNRNAMLDTTNDTLFVWIEQQHKGNNWPNYQLMVYDKAATACAGNAMMTSRRIRQGDEIVGIRLDAFPRHQRKFYLRVQEWNPQTGQQTMKNGFVISNPARGYFPSWSPDSLPNPQEDDDLSVTLNRLEFGAKEPYMRNNDKPNDPINKGVLAAFKVEQNGKTATNWQPAQVETSDATGNHITGWCNSHWEGNEEVTTLPMGIVAG